MKTAKDYEKEFLEILFDDGDLVDDNFGRFYSRKEGILESMFKQYASECIERYDKNNFNIV